METAVPVGRPRTVARMAFLGGALYVVLFVVGTILLFSGAPDSSSAPAKIIKYYSDSGHRDRNSTTQTPATATGSTAAGFSSASASSSCSGSSLRCAER